MILKCRDELICDFAETYRIYDYRELPPHTAAVLACGLRDDSRVKMKLQKLDVPFDTLLLAAIADRMALQLYSGTKDAQHHRNKPELLAPKLLQGQEEDKVQTFKTAAEFEAAFYNLAGGE